MPIRFISHTSATSGEEIRVWLASRDIAADGVEERVRDIIAQVRSRGDQTIINYTHRFDYPDLGPDVAAEIELA